MTLKEIVTQLKSCGFTCEAGSLEMNVAFKELEKMANFDSADVKRSVEIRNGCIMRTANYADANLHTMD